MGLFNKECNKISNDCFGFQENTHKNLYFQDCNITFLLADK